MSEKNWAKRAEAAEAERDRYKHANEHRAILLKDMMDANSKLSAWVENDKEIFAVFGDYPNGMTLKDARDIVAERDRYLEALEDIVTKTHHYLLQKESQMKQEVSELYLQQVNTERLVIKLRESVRVALEDKMQFATAIGTLKMMIREVEDDAISQLKLVSKS